MSASPERVTLCVRSNSGRGPCCSRTRGRIAFRHANVTPQAAFNLGVLREQEGDPAGAAAAYQLSIDSGQADLAPRAAQRLGQL